jgi:hypothetical protein
MKDREEHLAWAKQRAHECVDRGEWQHAIASMISDLSKHRELQMHPGVLLGLFCEGPEEMKRWIDGFN